MRLAVDSRQQGVAVSIRLFASLISPQNPTCPHCRMEVLEGIHFVPNIIVDQIIERKLRALTDGPQKMDMQIDRQEKIE
jgi:hypothetical protein